MTRGAALTGALLVTLGSPQTWPLALAAFLLRGGVVLVALPIVVLPTPVGLGNLLAPTLTAAVFGGVTTGLIVLVAAILMVGIGWVVAGGLLAATLEAEAARVVAAEADDAEPVPRRRAEAGRILMARLIAHLPLGVALAWGSARLVAVTYRELTNPFDVATPIVWRVLRASPEVVVAVFLTWMVGQAVGAIAARRIAIVGAGPFGALREAAITVLRRPMAVFADFCLPTAVLGLALAPSALAAASAANAVRLAMSRPSDPVGLVLAVVLFVSLWTVGLAMAGVICAWRAAVWTVGFGEPAR
ncbi:MAG: hypothetical protein QOJ75_821 [Chloroflexota bacterium]|nr:hypothetical protein [Chloroflexota bacterium]